MFEAAKRAESPQTNEIGEFTRMFQAQQSSTDSADAQSPPPATPAPSKSEPGEFTRMFQAPASAPQSAIGSSPLPTAHESKQEPGEFTRMFQAPAPPQPKEDIGVSTRTFQVPVMKQEPPPPPPPTPPQPQTKNEPGEFTRMFQTPSAPAPEPAAPPPQKSGPGEFTRISKPRLIRPRHKLLPCRPAAGPGEFTRMFQTPQAAPRRRNQSSPKPRLLLSSPARVSLRACFRPRPRRRKGRLSLRTARRVRQSLQKRRLVSSLGCSRPPLFRLRRHRPFRLPRKPGLLSPANSPDSFKLHSSRPHRQRILLIRTHSQKRRSPRPPKAVSVSLRECSALRL